MRSQDLKEYIINNDYVERILEELGCNYIHNHGEYITASNPDGDNKQAVVVYYNENLTTVNYTRSIAKGKRATDLFDLIAFYNDFTFPEALQWTCGILGLDYYEEAFEVSESLQILKMLKDMCSGDDEDDIQVKPISEKILTYYLNIGNKMFEDDGIDLMIQKEFEVGYDPQSNYITIPIRDAIGNLIGVKGRYFGEPDEFHLRYLYVEKCGKSKVLYGYWQNREYIKRNTRLYIVESEKAVQQLATIGVRNVVATGGKTISKTQVELIIRTGCAPVFAFDKDVPEEELIDIAGMFMNGVPVYAVIDKDNILDEKESPSDNPVKWQHLINNNIYKLKEAGGD